ncbi:MAG: AAA family ATPase [bacterium]|nr:AAA family ATPase [bacterium]
MHHVIGITGQPGSGKDTVADYLAQNGFKHISLGDTIREIMTELGFSLDRPTMHKYTKDLFLAGGTRVITSKVIDQITGHAVVSGFRNRLQIEHFKEVFGNLFLFVCVDAPIELRYSRVSSRQREGDRVTFEEFKIQEDHERSNDVGSHEVDRIIEIADLSIENSGTREELLAQLNALVPLQNENFNIPALDGDIIHI